jgi:hypothetical protein
MNPSNNFSKRYKRQQRKLTLNDVAKTLPDIPKGYTWKIETRSDNKYYLTLSFKKYSSAIRLDELNLTSIKRVAVTLLNAEKDELRKKGYNYPIPERIIRTTVTNTKFRKEN